MLKKVAFALTLAAAGFAAQTASANPLGNPTVIPDASAALVQRIQYYDPPRYEGPPQGYYERPYWRRGDGPPPWARAWWRRHHERPYWEGREHYGRRW
jgi:hypothetical protein